jgi:iron complex transport system substrate-binding protein
MRIVVLLFVLLSTVVNISNAQQRVITAGSAITEIVCELGDCDKIIATDRTSLHPVKVQQLPSIGYRNSINAEGILSLKPTLIIAEKDYVEDAVLQQLSASGVKLVIIEKRVNFDDIRKSIEKIAVVLGRQTEGKALIAKNETALAEARSMLQRSTLSPSVLCVYNRGTATVSVAGKDTFAEILSYVGTKNAIASIDGYKPLNTEALIAANPDYLLMISTGLESLGGIDGVLKIPGVAQTTAGKKKQIIGIESLRLTNFGPRFGETVKELVVLLHPELQAK